ncbi:polysaccharide biosynthesis tyrosine autokinase [Psychrobacter frigidicola]|uniref:Polysaccharide biosynthesis tyrosine autokinase n=1 Tax=Psychrobacter frigidicola TaxID=45611 RepID=A0A5C7A4N8_9GAMM|nr:polysaccharide biosynthesis tyrosine autokinase [Psychrobacter frigidicola]TXD98088.1 polysaccharide biosynthesis tyrosine autokinase [Psychrobacter frigidicola]
MNTNSNNLSKSASEKDNNDINLLSLLSVLLRGWKVVVFLTLLGWLIGVLYSRYETPIFKSDALIQVDKSSQGISALGSNISELVSPDVGPAQTEVRLIQSRMILKPVVDLLHLSVRLNDPTVNSWDRIKNNRTDTQFNTPEGVSLKTENGQVEVSQFNVSQDYLNRPFTLVRSDTGFVLSNGFDDFKGQLNQPHLFKGTDGVIQITVTDLPAGAHPINISKQSLQDTTDSINSALTVTELDSSTGILQLSLTGANQQQITSILKQIIISYVDQNQSRGSEETTTTLKFMETQIPLLKQKLEDSEAVFNEFRKNSGSIDINQEAGLLVGKIDGIDNQLNELKLKKADLTTYYTEDHPLVVQINDQLKVLNAKQREVEGKITDLPEIQKEFLKLSEDMGINREIYLTMLKNYEQLKIVKAGQIGNARIVDLPISTYRTIAPKKQQLIMLATLSGLLLGILLVFLRSLLNNTVKDPNRLETKTGVPVIATIPRSLSLTRLGKNKNTPNRLLAYVDHNSLSYEAIKSLRTHLMLDIPGEEKSGQRANVILITGESIGVGKSFISANLTEVFGQLNKKVLIIDADMRMGELHKVFNIEQNVGLADYLSQDDALLQNNERPQTDNSLTNFIHPTAMNNIDFMPRGQQPHNPTSLLASDRLGELMSEVNAYYDYIVIDSPPILAASDAVILSRYTDKVLLVTRYNSSMEGQLVYAIKQLTKAHVQVDGIVLNDVQQDLMNKYSYHYNYAYGDNK